MKMQSIHTHKNVPFHRGFIGGISGEYRGNIDSVRVIYRYIQKKEGLPPGNPIFINLKSNTMKNTMQRYYNLRIYANYLQKNMFYSIKFAYFENCCLQTDRCACWKVTKCQSKSTFCYNVKVNPPDRQISITKYTFRHRKRDFFCQTLANVKELLYLCAPIRQRSLANR